MQAIILAHSEPSELSQLSVSNCSGLLPYHKGTLLSNLVDRFIESDVFDVVIVHHESQSSVLEHFVRNNRARWPSHSDITLCSVPANCSVLDCFQRLRPRITADYVFVTYSTTAMTDLNVRRLFLTLVRNQAHMVAVFAGLPLAESKLCKSLPRELVLSESGSDALLGYFAASDIKKHSTLPRLFVKAGTDILIRSDLREAGFYLLTRSFIETLARSREDSGHRKKTICQLVNSLSLNSSRFLNLTSSDICGEDSASLSVTDTERQYMTAPCSSGTCLYEHQDRIVCMKLEDPFLFLEGVRLTFQKSADASNTAAKKDRNHVAAGCDISPSATVRSSFICSQCTIGPNVEIFNSVLLPGVTVKEGCVIQGCVLGEAVTVEERCKLKNCAAATGQRVPLETILEAELLGFTDPALEGGQT